MRKNHANENELQTIREIFQTSGALFYPAQILVAYLRQKPASSVVVTNDAGFVFVAG